MADTITPAINISRSTDADNEFVENFSKSLTVSQAANGISKTIITTSTSDTAFAFANITTEGWLVLYNLDATDSIDWGPDSGGSIVDCGTLEAGEWAAFRMKAGATMRHQATANTPKLLVLLFED